MGGWTRLFIVVSCLVITPAFVIWAINKPRDGAYLYECSTPVYPSIDDAKTALESGNFKQKEYYPRSDCEKALARIASGEDLKSRTEDWWGTFVTGAGVILIFLGMIYGIGRSIGWVWRGFFPKNKTNEH